MTPARPTSEPVPAVVGTATIGAMPAGSARVHQSPMSSKSHIGRVWPLHEGDDLAAVERRAAAEGDDPVVAAVAQHREPGGDVRLGRVRACTSEKTAAVEPRRRAAPPSASRGDRQPHEAGVGDEERPGDAGRAAGVAELGDPPGAEADRGRIVPVAGQAPCSEPPAGGRTSAGSRSR